MSALKTENGASAEAAAMFKEAVSEKPPTPAAYKSFKIKMSDSGEIKDIPADEYVCGVVAAEMPADYEPEALKAQAVAAYTFACYRKAKSKTDYDLTDEPKTDQCYITEQQAREKWKDSADEYINKIKEAQQAVSGMILMYEGATALTVYHAMSSGMTENCADVWGSDIPYLVSVDSAGDRTADGYLNTTELSEDEVSSALSQFKKAEGEADKWFSEPQRTAAGRIKTVKYCGTELDGGEVASALGLRSANFDAEHIDGGFKFTTRGYGHGVGMSQTGAGYMAKQGSSCEEILVHYYPGCVLMKEK